MTKRINYKRIQDVLIAPKEILPYLSEYDSQILLIDILRAYKEGIVDFPTLITITETMRYYTSPTTKLWQQLLQIRELNKSYDLIETELGKILRELQKTTNLDEGSTA